MDAVFIRDFGVLLVLLVVSAGGFHSGQKSPCKYTHQFRKYTADCVHQDLKSFPGDLNEDIEILVANENRIRELHNDSLAPYGSLQYLYLSNNFIVHIEPGAFIPVPKLEVLDLSENAIRVMTGELPLPLRKLYLNGNRDLVTVPLTKAFGLQYLSLAECHLSDLPDIGELPNLTELNITGNPISTVSAERLAPLCRLKFLYVPEGLFYDKKVDACRCHEFLHWTTKYGVQANLSHECTELGEVQHEMCLSNRSAWFEARQECLSRKPPSAFWQSSGAITAAGVVLLSVVAVALCCIWRRSRRKRNSVKHQHQHPAVNHQQQSNNHRLQSPDLDSSTKKSTIV